MSSSTDPTVPDNTPIIIGAGQFTEHLPAEGEPALNSPMNLAAQAAQAAILDGGGELMAGHIDAVACIRQFSDSASAWACPFGGSDNPPESIARRLGATPATRIYSLANGAEPLKLTAELMGGITRGEYKVALLTGAEAIASQRHAQRAGIELDWSDQTGTPMDDRGSEQTVASRHEMLSGMYLPAHFYALIENYRAWQQGRSPQQHRERMAALFASFSAVASNNPHAFWQQRYSSDDLLAETRDNFPICLPYTRRLVAQDAVNQAAALVLTSAGHARELGIPAQRWVFLQGYAAGEDRFTSERLDPGSSAAMQAVFRLAQEAASASGDEFDLIDIYSCFPCAVEAACDALVLPADGSRPLTVTGGLPYFGGPGNNYSMHALVEMAHRVRGGDRRALVTANGGILSKHAAAILAGNPHAGGAAPLDLSNPDAWLIDREGIPGVTMAERPETGRVMAHTVIFERKRADRAIILGETDSGERFLASSEDTATVASLKRESPAGRAVTLSSDQGRNTFHLAV